MVYKETWFAVSFNAGAFEQSKQLDNIVVSNAELVFFFSAHL